MAGPTGFDFGVAIYVARAMEIIVDQRFFEKLKIYESTILEELGKKNKTN